VRFGGNLKDGAGCFFFDHIHAGSGEQVRNSARALMLPPRLGGAGIVSPRLGETLVWPAVLVLGYIAGASVATDAQRMRILFLLPVLGLALAVQPEKLFVGWLFAAPLVQGASNGSHYGHSVNKFFFLGLSLLLIVRMALGSVRIHSLWAIDALPALYFFYVVVSARFFPSAFTSAENSTLKALYISIGVGIVGYYFAAFANTSRRFPQMVAGAFVWSGLLVAVLGIVDGLTGWNLWNQHVANGDISRAVSTFPSPFEFGTYLGACVAFALAILVYRGPRSLKLPSIILVGVSIPAFYYTYTRGPILAIAIVAVLMVVIRKRARWPSVLVLATVGILLFASWGRFTSSAVYEERLGVDTAKPRAVLTDVAFDLFRQRPLFGQGYGTFDQVKLTLPIQANQAEIVKTTTSHDTFLTVLAELGAFGLALLVLPWLIIGWRAVTAGWSGAVEPWIVAGCVGAAATYAIGAVTYDARFFPLISAIPWITLGLVRKTLGEHPRSLETG
jgi:O-antigen ligase